MWVRGLKRFKRLKSVCSIMSHPMWVRGLKPAVRHLCKMAYTVAPHVGAWIETLGGKVTAPTDTSRTPCGCVD